MSRVVILHDLTPTAQQRDALARIVRRVTDAGHVVAAVVSPDRWREAYRLVGDDLADAIVHRDDLRAIVDTTGDRLVPRQRAGQRRPRPIRAL